MAKELVAGAAGEPPTPTDTVGCVGRGDLGVGETLFLAVALTVPVGGAVAFWVFWHSATVVCRHHTVDACIPAAELLLGLVAGLAIGAWWAIQLLRSRTGPGNDMWSRGRPALPATVAVLAGVGVWAALVQVLGRNVVCRPREADYVCGGGFVMSAALLLVVVITAPGLAQRTASERPPSSHR